VKKTKGLFPGKNLWKEEVYSRTANYAYISGYAGLRRLTKRLLKSSERQKDYILIT
jgi:hypothetical protein